MSESDYKELIERIDELIAVFGRAALAQEHQTKTLKELLELHKEWYKSPLFAVAALGGLNKNSK